MDDVQARLVKCFSAVFPELKEVDVFGASMKTVARWDSVATVTLVNVIEEEFHVEVDPEVIEEMISFAAISSRLKSWVGTADVG